MKEFKRTLDFLVSKKLCLTLTWVPPVFGILCEKADTNTSLYFAVCLFFLLIHEREKDFFSPQGKEIGEVATHTSTFRATLLRC